MPDPDLASARALRDQAREMDRNLAPHMMRVVDGRDKWLYLARETMLPDQVEIDPYPHLTPQGDVGDGAEGEAANVMSEAATLINRLEDRTTDYGLHNVLSHDEQTECLLIGTPIIPKLTTPFEVVALPGRPGRWLMNEGTLVNGRGQTLDIPRQVWETRRGFIVARIRVEYLGLIDGVNMWDSTVIGTNLEIVQELTCSPMAYISSSPETWTPGEYMVPYAFVRTRAGLPPLVVQFRTSHTGSIYGNLHQYFIVS